MYYHPTEGVQNFGCQVKASHLQEIKCHVDNNGPYTPSHIFNTNGTKQFYTRYSFTFTTGCLEWVNQTLADNNHYIPNACSNDLEQIYILLVSKIKAHSEYGNRHPTLRLLLKPVSIYTWTPTPNISSTCILHDIKLSDMKDE